METRKTLDINQHLVNARNKMSNNNHNDYNNLFNNLLKKEAKTFLLGLTGNEIFYFELYEMYKQIKIEPGYKKSIVFLDVNEITSNLDNCYDILTDYSNYYDFI